MSTRPIPWRQRAPALLLAALLQGLFIVAFLHALMMRASPIIVAPLQVHIITPSVRPALQPPPLYAPPLTAAARLPPLIVPKVSFPSTAPARPAPAPKVALRSGSAPSVTGEAETPPQLLSGPPDADSDYPVAARMSFTEGNVWTRVCVYSTGEIASVALLESSGDRELDQAALQIARQTRWKPAMLDGQPVARCSRFRVDFSLFH